MGIESPITYTESLTNLFLLLKYFLMLIFQAQLYNGEFPQTCGPKLKGSKLHQVIIHLWQAKWSLRVSG